MARHINHRSKPKKRINRYNPNHPDWKAVHLPDWQQSVLPVPIRDPLSVAIDAFLLQQQREAASE